MRHTRARRHTLHEIIYVSLCIYPYTCMIMYPSTSLCIPMHPCISLYSFVTRARVEHARFAPRAAPRARPPGSDARRGGIRRSRGPRPRRRSPSRPRTLVPTCDRAGSSASLAGLPPRRKAGGADPTPGASRCERGERRQTAKSAKFISTAPREKTRSLPDLIAPHTRRARRALTPLESARARSAHA